MCGRKRGAVGAALGSRFTLCPGGYFYIGKANGRGGWFGCCAGFYTGQSRIKFAQPLADRGLKDLPVEIWSILSVQFS